MRPFEGETIRSMVLERYFSPCPGNTGVLLLTSLDFSTSIVPGVVSYTTDGPVTSRNGTHGGGCLVEACPCGGSPTVPTPTRRRRSFCDGRSKSLAFSPIPPRRSRPHLFRIRVSPRRGDRSSTYRGGPGPSALMPTRRLSERSPMQHHRHTA